MSTIRELITSFFEASRERLKNPIVGAFAISWLAINWRFVAVLLFSRHPIEYRIDIIEECYLNMIQNVWYPLIITGIYILILPNLMALVDVLSKWAINIRKQISNQHKLNDVTARQEIAVEERQLELVEEGSPDISKLKEKIEALEKERSNLIEQLDLRNTDEHKDEDEQQVESKNVKSTKSKKRTTTAKNTHTVEKVSSPLPTSKDYPAMRDNVIRNVAKSEKEWILLYAFYSSDFGSKEFMREDLFSAYDETKRRTDSRIANLSNNINNLVKQGFVRFLNDTEMLLTDSGKELSREILNR